MMAFKVVTNVENTGLDGVVFATRLEAVAAECDCKLVFTESSFEIVETSEPANTTYEEWSETGW
jgi:hypothetical protein